MLKVLVDLYHDTFLLGCTIIILGIVIFIVGVIASFNFEYFRMKRLIKRIGRTRI